MALGGGVVRCEGEGEGEGGESSLAAVLEGTKHTLSTVEDTVLDVATSTAARHVARHRLHSCSRAQPCEQLVTRRGPRAKQAGTHAA